MDEETRPFKRYVDLCNRLRRTESAGYSEDVDEIKEQIDELVKKAERKGKRHELVKED